MLTLYSLLNSQLFTLGMPSVFYCTYYLLLRIAWSYTMWQNSDQSPFLPFQYIKQTKATKSSNKHGIVPSSSDKTNTISGGTLVRTMMLDLETFLPQLEKILIEMWVKGKFTLEFVTLMLTTTFKITERYISFHFYFTCCIVNFPWCL